MRTRTTLLACAAVACATLACELTSIELADVADVVVAEVYLRPGETTHMAFLHRTVPGPDGSLAVDDARITVTGPGGVIIRFDRTEDPAICAVQDATGEAADGSCYLAADQGRVRAGEAYRLEIERPAGRRIHGATTVPGEFRLLSPGAPECVLDTTSLDLVWTRSAGAWAYQADAVFSGLAEGLAARGIADPPDTLRLLGLALGEADTTMAFPRDFGVFDRFQVDLEVLLALRDGLPEGARVELVLAAADRNYVNWVRGGNFNPSGPVRVSSLSGDGVGVFAALLGKSRVIHAPGPAAEGLPSCASP
jgi:hypothetical protein